MILQIIIHQAERTKPLVNYNCAEVLKTAQISTACFVMFWKQLTISVWFANSFSCAYVSLLFCDVDIYAQLM